MIGMEEVLLASRQSGATIPPSAVNTADFSCSFSTTASTTTFRSARSASSVVKDSRASAASRSASVNFPARTARPSDVVSLSWADSAAASSTSRTSTSWPARAETSAMPDPMMPPPTTPTLSAMILLVLALPGGAPRVLPVGCMVSRGGRPAGCVPAGQEGRPPSRGQDNDASGVTSVAPPHAAGSTGGALMISGKTTLIAHLGYPTFAFKAPLIYNPWFDKNDIDAVVVPMGVKAEEYPEFFRYLFKLTNIRGALVTMPHKVTTIGLVDELTPTATVAGAANAVLLREDGTLVGDQFDGTGFVRGVQRKGFELPGRRALVVGNGGVGSAIAASLAGAGVGTLGLFDPDAEASESLAKRLQTHYPDIAVTTG